MWGWVVWTGGQTQKLGVQRAPISPHQELETGGYRPPEFLEDEGWGKGVGLEGLVGKDQ